MLLTKWSTSSLLTYLTPKFSMMRVKDIGQDSWYHSPGVLMCSKYTNGASLCHNLLFPRMPACSKPQTAHLISKWTYPLYANNFRLYCSWIHSGTRTSSIWMYLKYSRHSSGKTFWFQGTYTLLLLCLWHYSNVVWQCQSPLYIPTGLTHMSWGSPWLWFESYLYPPSVGGIQQLDYHKWISLLCLSTCLISSCIITNILALVHFWPVLLSPCAILPKSLPSAICHISAIAGLFINYL